MAIERTYRAGSAIEDYCRACKTDRMHTVIAADANGQPLRVNCGYCHSEHNYRGGPRVETDGEAASPASSAEPRSAAPSPRSRASGPAFPLVAERERQGPAIMLPEDSTTDLELLLRR